MLPLATIRTPSKALYSLSGDDLAADIDANFASLAAILSTGVEITVGSATGADYLVSDYASLGAAVNAASVAVNALGGGTVKVLRGTFTLTSGDFIVPRSRVWIRGAGIDATVIKPAPGSTGGNGDVFRMINPAAGTYTDTIFISDLTIDCSAQYSGGVLGTDTTPYSNAMTLQGWNNLQIERVRIIDPYGFGIVIGTVAGAAPYSENFHLSDIYIEGERNGNDSIGGGGVRNGLIENYYFENGYGTVGNLTNQENVTWRNIYGKRTGASYASAYADGLGTDFGASNVLYENIHVDGAKNGIMVESISLGQARDVHIRKAFLTNCKNSGIVFNASATYGIQGFSVADVDLSNWNESGNGSQGVVLVDSKNGSVSHVKFGAQNNASNAVRLNSADATSPTHVQIHHNDFTTGANQLQLTVVGADVSIKNNSGLNPECAHAQGNVTGATTFNRVNGDVITATLTGDITVTLTAGKVAGDQRTLILTQDGTGSRLVTWPSNFKKAGGTLTLSTGAGAVDVIKMRWEGTNWREVSRSLDLS